MTLQTAHLEELQDDAGDESESDRSEGPRGKRQAVADTSKGKAAASSKRKLDERTQPRPSTLTGGRQTPKKRSSDKPSTSKETASPSKRVDRSSADSEGDSSHDNTLSRGHDEPGGSSEPPPKRSRPTKTIERAGAPVHPVTVSPSGKLAAKDRLQREAEGSYDPGPSTQAANTLPPIRADGGSPRVVFSKDSSPPIEEGK